ncbi:hypothetical protein F4782DRAFT_521442 [Xylaria castorea]|nr:hypothetical protein F4782DRAFT_521442 [Xylaria castorea]
MDWLTPHVSPLLSDNAEMQDYKLNVVEVCYILFCTLRRLSQKEYQCHRIIPITVISLSGYLASYMATLMSKSRSSEFLNHRS